MLEPRFGVHGLWGTLIEGPLAASGRQNRNLPEFNVYNDGEYSHAGAFRGSFTMKQRPHGCGKLGLFVTAIKYTNWQSECYGFP
jgi:hypothetical protein